MTITIYPDPTKISIENSQVTSGGQTKTRIMSEEFSNILEQILIELRIANIHNQLMTDDDITEKEIQL